jgi:hypothetical protein
MKDHDFTQNSRRSGENGISLHHIGYIRPKLHPLDQYTVELIVRESQWASPTCVS